MIYLCFNVYNEEQFLKDAILSAKNTFSDVAHIVIVIDGAYADFPYENNNHLSTDKTIDIATEHAEIVYQTFEALYEYQKRSLFFLYGSIGDYFLQIDADEMCIGKFDKEILNFDYASVEIQRPDIPPYKAFRWYKQLSLDIEFKNQHNSLYVDGKLINGKNWQREFPMLYGIQFQHLTNNRTQKRIKQKQEYYKTLTKKESTFMESIHR